MTDPTTTTSSTSHRFAALKRLLWFRRVSEWFWNTTHNGLAMAGIGVVSVLLVLASQSAIREPVETRLLDWLQTRQDERLSSNQEMLPEPTAADRVSATLPGKLAPHQAALSKWISRYYRVATPPINVLVAEAYAIGERTQVDPALILAIVAVESRFNPYARSPVGAEGLMQVLTRVHTDKFEAYGGPLAAFDPVANLHVGTMVLQECIARAKGSVKRGLFCYVGAVTVDGTFYLDRVLKVYERMQKVLAPYDLPPYKQTLAGIAAQRAAAKRAPTLPATTPSPRAAADLSQTSISPGKRVSSQSKGISDVLAAN